MLEDHKQKADKDITYMIITVSDTRTKATDKSGQLIHTTLEEEGFTLGKFEIVVDEKEDIQQAIKDGVNDAHMDAIIINGGTGIANRDVTIESVQPLFDKEIPGFGELFRYLSYKYDIGPAAMLSRATAGTIRSTVLFAMPGSSKAVELAMKKLIVPELAHMVFELKKDR
ncbi:MogA/MoaB family molybdenum cofactor biosynthesis protein [Radiobacillus kanasensis]|uniref:MogA/MoaB family molybdenum cofactor biosynthesis protein n=1 Tax=Radiobacillus kanasensis TaxID=2844358 RepID=UPI001E4F498D|nr:MogA/MoaB family molybdenum cofactor biosynthesis protein [Radiobacillus kanasensis]UFT98308.1 MogA/MoaB family molybdenum cofactor biosynthesis protein [Radiobacillus kanasensis]